MNGKCLSFHLFKRVEKKNLLSRIMNYCHSPLSTPSIFSSLSSSSSSSSISTIETKEENLSSKEATGSISENCQTYVSSTKNGVKEELFTTVPPRWTLQEFNDVSDFINKYIDNTGALDETSKTALMIQQCHSVIIIEDINFGYSGIPDEVKTYTPERIVVAAIIISNESEEPDYGINSISLNDTFETPCKKIMVNALLFNESIKSSKRRILAMIVIHHLFQLCKANEITNINALTNDETFQFFMDSGFSNKTIPVV